MDIETGDLSLETPAWPDGLQLPSLRFAVVCDLNVWGTGPSKVSMVVPDGLQDKWAQCYRRQCRELDLRKLDTRLVGFTEPLRVNFDIAVVWPETNQMSFELSNLNSVLCLPE